ncbi:hypothetical protein [Streptomyces subrutilus]|uniref:Uncharacterized protein n=1 Tax=Streptomyces subrutilus TaxID=36818 RepID=A0A1E5Q0J9_9ACTN|nr:hypothetical protein [Streptomyces subrutilus]OEJ35327.1 hypothetical protein BGK67_32150 [Streptomyces subrutilus]
MADDLALRAVRRRRRLTTALPLQPRGDGTRAAQVSLPAHSSHSFRYLAAGDYWFNGESADHHDGTNSSTVRA